MGVAQSEVDGLSERAAQSLLAIRENVETKTNAHPACFQAEFDPADEVCNGCVFFASCWRGCTPYLKARAAGTVGDPRGVPASVLDAALTRPRPADPPPPPVKRKPPPPPPRRPLPPPPPGRR